MMFGKFATLTASAVVAIGLAGTALAQGMGPAQAQGGAQGGGGGLGYDADQSAGGPAGGQRPLDVPVLYVTGIEVMKATLDPKVDVVRVTGLASSAGWTGPQLVPFFYGKPTDSMLDLQLIATSPEQSQKAEGFQPVSATFTLEAGHPFKGVRVRAAGNAIELKQMTGSTQTQIKTNDCKECIGKKFVEKGAGGAPGAGTVRGEDLPPDYRPIGPTHGVKGMVHNPNRINLVLDADNTIVMAFWE